MPRPQVIRHLLPLTIAVVLAIAGCTPPAPPAGPTSIVQLGDSIAAGEGTLYGYEYDVHSQRWTGGNIDAKWPGPYPICHTSPDAYGVAVAKAFDAAFTQFACTGATFAAGITAPEMDDGAAMRPAQFGNWATQTDINAEYDAAKPDLVLVTLGADDVQFTAIVEDCIENAYAYYWDLEDERCIPSNPGATIQTDFFDFLPTLQANYGTLVEWIDARAKANGVAPPKIVFSNYANPLPPDGVKCNDTSWLYPEQVSYLSTLVGQMNARIEQTITELATRYDNVGFVDFSGAYDGPTSHRWCTDDPWAYGLSIYSFSDPWSFESQAPFHPTPAGQAHLASLVEPVVDQLFGRS